MNNFSMTEIKFPEMRQIVMGKDSSSIILDTIPVLLVVYRDPSSCVPCQIDHIQDYRNLYELGKIAGDGYSPIFIFSPNKRRVESVRLSLCRARFRHPIFLDENGSFPEMNRHIPADPRLHVFLLDRNRRVILSGDPCHNPSLLILYKKTLVSGENFSDKVLTV